MQLRVLNIASVQFRHQFFAPQGFDWENSWPDNYSADLLPIAEPTTTTKALFDDLGLYFRTSKKGFDIYAAVKQDGAKFLQEKPADKNAFLYFYLKKPAPIWDYFTRSNAAENGFVIYSNLSGFHSGGGATRYLHQEVIPSAAGDKAPGTLVRKGTKVYEAVKKTSSQPPGSNWEETGQHVDFSTLSNTIPLNTGMIRLAEPSLANALLTVHDRYDNVVMEKSFPSDSTEKESSVAIDFLEEGIYSYKLNGTLKGTFYLAPKVPATTFGILCIAIQGKPLIITPAQRQDEDWLPIANGTQTKALGEVNPRSFAVHFINNTALWCYVFSSDLGIKASDVPSTYKKNSSIEYESKKAIPILASSTGPDFGLAQRLPAPQPGRLTPQLNGSDEIEAFISEIYVNV